MSKERKMILDMIETGKITAEEALMLFDALDSEGEDSVQAQIGENLSTEGIPFEIPPKPPIPTIPPIPPYSNPEASARHIHFPSSRRMRQPDPGYAAALNAGGFNPSPRKIINLMEEEVSIEEIQELQSVRRKEWTDDDLADFLIHEVDKQFILDLHELGLGNTPPQKIVELAIHDITPAYIRKLQEVMGTDVGVSTLIEFGIHDVSPEFVQVVQSLNLKNLSLHHLVELAIHDANLKALRAAADCFGPMTANEAVNMSVHEVTEDFINAVTESGIDDISMRDLIEMRIHDVDIEMIQEAKRLGPISASTVVELAIHGGSAKYIRDVIETGLPDLTPSDLIEMLVQGVKPGYIMEMLALELPDLTGGNIIEMKIQGLRPEEARKGKEFLGEACTASKLITLKIHGSL